MNKWASKLFASPDLAVLLHLVCCANKEMISSIDMHMEDRWQDKAAILSS